MGSRQKKNARGESGARPRVVLSRNDRRSRASEELADDDDVSIEDEFTRGTRDEPTEEEFLEDSEVEEGVREAMKAMTKRDSRKKQDEEEEDVVEIDDEDGETWAAGSAEEEEEAVVEPPAKKKKLEKLECVAVQAEACTTPSGTAPVLIRERLSGWIYCELCWNALLLQQEEAGGDCEFDGEYIDTDEYGDD